MNFTSTALLALAMSTDAFAAAIGKGAALDKPQWREALRSGAIFGTIEAITPVIGWSLGSLAARYVVPWDHWIAFALLAVLGVKMIVEGLEPDDGAAAAVSRHSFRTLAITGFATSIDALAVGVGLSFVDVKIMWVAAAIGLTTFIAVSTGVMLGRLLNRAVGRWAEVAGGVILIGIGSVILYQHLSAAAA